MVVHPCTVIDDSAKSRPNRMFTQGVTAVSVECHKSVFCVQASNGSPRVVGVGRD